jgi:PP-loop superfamily ATP-utilizing enzyme
VRHYGDTAKVEIDRVELTRLLDDDVLSAKVVDKLKELGYNEVIIDPEGYRRGSANTFLQQ